MDTSMKKNILPFLLLFASYGYIQAGSLKGIENNRDTVTILSYNDFHGAFIAGQNVPGAALFVQALLNEKARSPHPVILSVGDNFSGSYFSLMTKGEPHEVFTSPVEGAKVISAIGNHEFDWGTDYLIKNSSRYFNYIAANVREKTNGKRIVPPCAMVSVPVFGSTDILKIGFIGLTTTETATGGKYQYVSRLTFDAPTQEYVQVLCDSLRKKEQADMVVVLMHIATSMKDGKPCITESDAKGITRVKGIDAIVSGHSHEVVIGEIDGIPVIQAGKNGELIGKLTFLVAKEQKNLRLTYLKGDLINVGENSLIKAKIDSCISIYELYSIYTKADTDLIHDRKDRNHYTQMGALVTASYVQAYQSACQKNSNLPKFPVIGVNHFNGIRAGIKKGDVTKSDIGNVLPLGGTLGAFRMTGKEVKELFTEGRRTTGSTAIEKRGFLQSSNMKLVIKKEKDKEVVSHLYYLTDGAKAEYKEISDNDEYIVVCDDFISTGGDEYPDKYFKNHRVEAFDGEIVNALLTYLKEQKQIPNSKATTPEVEPERNPISSRITY